VPQGFLERPSLHGPCLSDTGGRAAFTLTGGSVAHVIAKGDSAGVAKPQEEGAANFRLRPGYWPVSDILPKRKGCWRPVRTYDILKIIWYFD
jgi:hypothetical protein